MATKKNEKAVTKKAVAQKAATQKAVTKKAAVKNVVKKTAKAAKGKAGKGKAAEGKAVKGKAAKSAVVTAGPPVEPATASVGSQPTGDGTILIWEDDPLSIPPRQPVQVPVPRLPVGSLGISIVDAAPPAGTHPPGTSRFRYWIAVEALSRGMNFWKPLLPANTKWATPDGELRVHLDKDVDLNAYYRRSTGTLEFFHSTVGGKTVFSGESPNVLCHELGHAVLDAIHPQLFHVAGIEAAAFHESFGDMSAILCALQLKTVMQSVIDETGGRIYHSTFLSRMAEELGWAIRQIRPQNVEPDCLRNAVNSFFYRDPMTLPTTAPSTTLSSAPHSFSRIFTAAFFDALAGMILIDAPLPTVQSIQKVSRNAGQLLIDAVGNAPVVTNYFSQVAAQMIIADDTRYKRKYRDVLKGAFVRHGVLSLEAAANIVKNQTPITNIAGIFGDDGADYQRTGELQPVAVAAAPMGFATDTLLCSAPGETGGSMAAAASALDTGSLNAPSYSEAVMSFVEDLMRLGRIDVGDFGDADSRISQPVVRKTHTLEKTEAGPLLARQTFDCGFD